MFSVHLYCLDHKPSTVLIGSVTSFCLISLAAYHIWWRESSRAEPYELNHNAPLAVSLPYQLMYLTSDKAKTSQ